MRYHSAGVGGVPLAIIVHSGDGPFLELAVAGVLLVTALLVYLTYRSVRLERHSPAANRSDG